MPSTCPFRPGTSTSSRISRSPVWNKASLPLNEKRNRAPRATNRFELPFAAGSKRRGAVANTRAASGVLAAVSAPHRPHMREVQMLIFMTRRLTYDVRVDPPVNGKMRRVRPRRLESLQILTKLDGTIDEFSVTRAQLRASAEGICN